MFARFGVLDVLSSTTPRPSGRKHRGARHLGALAMKSGEKCRLRRNGDGSLFVDVWKDLGVDARLLPDEIEGFTQIIDTELGGDLDHSRHGE